MLPKFSSSSGLVGAHTENVEPTPGTFVTAGQTVTPSRLSGKVEISREAAAIDAALDASLTSQLVPLVFIRGGLPMRELVLQVDLYTKLVLAKDTAGRRLFQVLSTRDTDGTDMSAVIVADGLVGKPAWALAATGSVSANSYLFDRTAVSGWATPPLRLTFDAVSVSKVQVGIWGYKALAIGDLTGVRRIAYDPV